MEFENVPEQKEESTKVERSKRSKNILTIFLVVALLITWGYIIYDRSKNREEKELLTTQIVSGDSARSQLQMELDDATFRIDALKSSNASADSLLRTKDKDIQELRFRVQEILNNKNASDAQLSEARRLIAQLKGNINTYTAEIESLKNANQQLTTEKNQLTQEKEIVQKNYDSANEVLRQKDTQLDIASTLHASNFNILGIMEKGNGKEKETTTAKKVDKLRITFDIDENRVTPSGPKEIFIVITAPDGKPVLVDALGSGKMGTRENGEIPYTKMVKINYIQGQKTPVMVEWSQNSPFQTGNYKIEIYNNGFKIGEGVRSFKKGGLFG